MLKNPDRLYPLRKAQWENNGDTIILFREKSKFKILRKLWGQYFRINLDKIGSFVWKLLDGGNSVEEISRRLEEEFKISDSEQRTQDFLVSLYRGGFIEFMESKE